MSDKRRLLVYSYSGCPASRSWPTRWRSVWTAPGWRRCPASPGSASLVSKANSGRRILAIDGCPLNCVRDCLAQHGIKADVHITLSRHGVRKRYGEDCSAEQADSLFVELEGLIASDRRLQPRPQLIEAP